MTTRERETLLEEVAKAVTQFQTATDQIDEAAAANLGINRTDLRCLGLLYGNGPMQAGQLGAAAQLSPGATTAAIDRLERAGYVRRVRTSEDRRGVLVEMTPTARERIENIYGPVGRAGMERLAGYSEAELTLVRDFLREGYRLQVEHAMRIRAASTEANSDAAEPS